MSPQEPSMPFFILSPSIMLAHFPSAAFFAAPHLPSFPFIMSPHLPSMSFFILSPSIMLPHLPSPHDASLAVFVEGITVYPLEASATCI